MTGFGRASVEVAEKRLRIEIRSVNHRGLDLKIRCHASDAFCESEIARAVRAAIERGAVTVSVREEAAPAMAAIDEAGAKAVYAALERLRHHLAIAAPVELSTVAAFLGAASTTDHLSGEALWEALRPGVDAALGELRATRGREGEALTVDLRARVNRLLELAGAIEAGAAGLPDRFARRLHERLAAVRDQPGFEPGRLAQEAALMAERLDISEELTRLGSHLAHLQEILGAGASGDSRAHPSAGAVGRKLDFVIQEVGRELNTIGSKAQDAAIASLVIDGKVELEKVREQAQNIE